MTFLTVHEVAQRWRFKTDKPVYDLKDDIGYTEIRGKILFAVDRVAAFERLHTISRDTLFTPCDAPGCDLPTAPELAPA